MAAIALGAALPSPRAEAGKLHVVIESLPCPARARLAKDIARRSAEVVAPRGDYALLVKQDAPGQLTLKLLGTATSNEQTMPFGVKDCPELANTVLLLLRSWVTSSWNAPIPELPPPPPPAPPRLPVAADLREPSPAPAGAAARRLSLVALAGAFGAFGSGLERVTSLHLVLDVSPRWGLGLFSEHHLLVRQGVEAGSVEHSLWAVGAVAHYTVPLSARWRIDLAAGPAVTLILAASSDYARTVRQDLYDLALITAGRLRFEFTDRLAWVTSLELEARLHAERLEVVGSPTLVDIGRVRAVAVTGVGFELF